MPSHLEPRSLLKPFKIVLGAALALILVTSGLAISACGAIAALALALFRRKPTAERVPAP